MEAIPNSAECDVEYPAIVQPTLEKKGSPRKASAEIPPTSLLLLKDFGPRDKTSQLLDQARRGLEEYAPKLIESGEGGSYFLKDVDGEIIAVFKPTDEDPFSLNNPKRKGEEDPQSLNNPEIKKGVLPGETAIREVAAYALDRDRFSQVPWTALVQLTHPFFKSVKTGSLQEYVEHECESWDFGPAKFQVRDVHHIGILDLRLFNLDRHGGNMLVQRNSKSELRLIPIDHGYSLPQSPEGTELWFEWFTWPHAKVAFDEETIKYVASIDVGKDAETLRRLKIREECVRIMMISTTVLKNAVARGMNLHQIASFWLKKNQKGKKPLPSLLETISGKLVVDSRSPFFPAWLSSTVDDTIEESQQKAPTKKKKSNHQLTRSEASFPLPLTSNSSPNIQAIGESNNISLRKSFGGGAGSFRRIRSSLNVAGLDQKQEDLLAAEAEQSLMKRTASHEVLFNLAPV